MTKMPELVSTAAFGTQTSAAFLLDQGKDRHEDQVQGTYEDTGLSNDETSEDNDEVQRGVSVKKYLIIRPSKNY
jgi:hypothetical protein